jgi:hypothetical protein
MIMCDLDLFNVCWSFVDMSTGSMVKDIKYNHEYISWVRVNLVLPFADFGISLGYF